TCESNSSRGIHVLLLWDLVRFELTGESRGQTCLLVSLHSLLALGTAPKHWQDATDMVDVFLKDRPLGDKDPASVRLTSQRDLFGFLLDFLTLGLPSRCNGFFDFPKAARYCFDICLLHHKSAPDDSPFSLQY